ncbi:MAG TPA: heavy-metal-associated domain-containing protein [Thiotrichaceae bacterium]|jgi:hypothetical protein|nr:heavy-metal-associated domain-containing protein [Thiotrichaceae bacterium]HIM06933.1 heavy-metal-associated domain-containing protein [Gammaproteobacteria bacterium]
MSYKTVFYVLVIYSISLLTPAYAKHNGFEGHDHATKLKADKSVDASDVTVLTNEAVIIVHGIVCSFCSQGVTRNLSKLPFIDKSKYTKGVKVEIEDQKVTIAIKPDSTLDLPQVFKSILKGGYEPVEAYVKDHAGNITLHKADGA